MKKQQTQSFSSDGGDREQGFEYSQIKIVRAQHNQNNNNDDSNKNNISFGNGEENRPQDFLPRSLYLVLPLKEISVCLQANLTRCEILNQNAQKCIIKSKPYDSLEQKYQKNGTHTVVYRKFPRSGDQGGFMCSFLSLKDVSEFNPLNYKTFSKRKKQEESLFDSNFQQGNLLYAYQLQDKNEFDLVLQNDVNTHGYNQWFYFCFRNKKVSSARFNIVNFVKKNTMFSYNVKPLVLSTKSKKADGMSWISIDNNGDYYKNSIKRKNGRSYYTLSFHYDFKYQNDEVYFAMNMPYSYTRLIKFLNEFCENNLNITNTIIQKKILCYSISNNPLPYLSLKTETSRMQVVLMARQHPGETVSSHLMEKILVVLLENPEILKSIQFIVIPMINPDGVIYGNFRTNLAGFDLNRQWLNPDKKMHPQVYYTKKLISSLPNVKFVMDLHGHSKKFNSFVYANASEDDLNEKLFACLLSRCDIFSLRDCSYGLTPDKMKTARAVLKNLGLHDIYTLETSFFGYTKDKKYVRFAEKDFKRYAVTILNSIQIYLLQERDNLEIQECRKFITNNLNAFKEWQNQKQSEDYSDSNPSEDELDEKEREEKVLIESNLGKQSSLPKKKLRKFMSCLRVNTPVIEKQCTLLSIQTEEDTKNNDIRRRENSQAKKLMYTKTERPELNRLTKIMQKPSNHFRDKSNELLNADSSTKKKYTHKRQKKTLECAAVTYQVCNKDEQSNITINNGKQKLNSKFAPNYLEPTRSPKGKYIIEYHRKELKKLKEKLMPAVQSHCNAKNHFEKVLIINTPQNSTNLEKFESNFLKPISPHKQNLTRLIQKSIPKPGFLKEVMQHQSQYAKKTVVTEKKLNLELPRFE